MKKELIKRIEALPAKGGKGRPFVDKKIVIGLIQTMDEPKQPTLDNIIHRIKFMEEDLKFVADWIEYCKIKKISLAHALYRSDEAENKSVYRWIVECLENQETYARAWLDGYEVEKEKRYRVVMPNVSSSGGVLTRIKHDDSWIWIDTLGTIVEGRTHTRKELEEAGFGWVFDCPGIEIEEAEE